MPWVNDETIKRSALAEIQSMLERGEDPENAAGGVEEEEEKKEETMETGMGEDGAGKEGGSSADGGMGLQRREEKPKVFGGLDLYDPDSPDVDDD